MTYDEHLAQANRFIDDSLTLRQQGSGMLAAEAIWGAAIQAMAAVSHAQSQDGHRHPQRGGFIRNLSRQYDLSPSLESGFGAVQNRLHNHFYTGRMNPQQLDEDMEHGIVFVQQMLNIARQNRNPG